MKKIAKAKPESRGADALRAEYRFDYGRSKPNRFARQIGEETIVVVLDSDVASIFGNSESVNSLLRSVAKALRQVPTKRKPATRTVRAARVLTRPVRARSR